MSEVADYAWVSDMTFPSLIPKYEVDESHGADVQERGARCRANKEGAVLPPQHMPRRAYSRKAVPPKLNRTFSLNGWPAVDEEVATLLRGFELGNGSLYPVQFYGKDRVTPLEGSYYVWNIGNVKDTLQPELSAAAEPHPYVKDRWTETLRVPEDFDLTLSAEAASGPDTWVEKRFSRRFFFSATLGDALAKMGLRKRLIMRRVRVLGLEGEGR